MQRRSLHRQKDDAVFLTDLLLRGDLRPMKHAFLDALHLSSSSEDGYNLRLRRVLAKAEDALMQAKLALAAGNADAANAALGDAMEAHTLAQEIRARREKTVAA